MNPIRFLQAAIATLGAVLALGATAPVAAQPAGLAQAGAFATLVGTIEIGSTQVDVTIPVSGLTSLRVQAIVPVPGAQVSLIGPGGNVVVPPNAPGTSFLDGQGLTPPLPGGVFITPDIANPAEGNWTLRASFPASPHKTVALLTVFADSPYQVGMVLTAPSYRVGQPVPLAMLVLKQGLPITGLAPQITVRKNGAVVTTLPGADSGQAADFDGKANDGIYSGGFTFADTGRYEVVGNVTIPLPGGGSVTRTATGFVDVVPVNYVLGTVTGTVVNGNACVARLDVATAATAQLPGIYATAATLKAPNGSTLVKRTSSTLGAPGPLSATVSFSAREIRSAFAEAGVLRIDPLDVVSFAGDTPQLEVRRANALSFPNLALSQFCTEPIEVGIGATVASTLRQNFIGQLDFKLPIRVNTAGNYQVSFKVIDAQGQEVGQFGLTQALAAGGNTINATVLADRLQKSDGPFTVDSVLVVGGGTTAQASRVPVAGSNFSRWQFFPTITGDLNGDGSVNIDDANLLRSMIAQVPQVPGDRRNLVVDAVISINDVRALTQRFCAAPNCPRN